MSFLETHRYFNTGDLVEFTQNQFGTKIIFHGRKDDQVKIRGNRIEVREIEAILSHLPGIKACYVNYSKSCDEKIKIIAYIIPTNFSNNEQNFIEEITQRLEAQLPNYMVPQHFIILKEFRLNANGKIDKNQLPLPVAPIEDRKLEKLEGYQQLLLQNEMINSKNLAAIPQKPVIQNENQKSVQNQKVEANTKFDQESLKLEICQIFSKFLLGISLKPDDNLFEFGADSLKILLAIQEVEEKLGITIELKEVFKQKTVKDIINNYQKGNERQQNFEKILNTKPKKSTKSKNFKIPLSYNQEHQYFIEKFNSFAKQDDSYYIPLLFKFSKPINLNNLKMALDRIIFKHAILRTKICANEDGSEMWQEVLSKDECFVDLEINSGLAKEIKFSILDDIPVKIKLEDEKNVQIFLHHIAVDGRSLAIIGKLFLFFPKD